MTRKVEVQKLGWTGSGYKILSSWKRPEGKSKSAMDAWIPGLSPSYVLRRRYSMGIFSWNEFKKAYLEELSADCARNLMKPLALLSLRRKLILLCDCANSSKQIKCPTEILSQALRNLRRDGDFALGFLPRSHANIS